MADPPDFAAIHKQVSQSLVESTRTTNSLVSQDVDFQRSLDPEAGTQLEVQSNRMLELARKVLSTATGGGSARVPAFQDAEDIEDNWRSIVDCLDTVLEKADICLDQYTGMIKRGDVDEAKESPKPKPKKKQYPWDLAKQFRDQNIPKPQLLFQDLPDNFDETPFKPLLTNKPHAKRSLEDSLQTYTNELGLTQYKHPYEYEIKNMKYPQSLWTIEEPIKYTPFEAEPATFVDTPEAVIAMLKELKQAKEIAIDLEHHDTHSYYGIVSLMQISTRNKDWVVDTLLPWRRDLQVLNEVFADPSIVKVFQGAFMDIVWLQRDLGLYIVGLFDTHHAARQLGFAHASLAFLLEKYTDFEPDKKFQMADWRIRPIPSEMFRYARSDTHFLLYIFDNLRNALIEKTHKSSSNEDQTRIVLENSKEVALLQFEKFVHNPETGLGAGGWFNWVAKMPHGKMEKEEFSAIRAIHAWRENLARQLDEAPGGLLNRSSLLNLAKQPLETPASKRLAVIRPLSPIIEQRQTELFKVIEKAQKKAPDVNVAKYLKQINPTYKWDRGMVAKAQTESKNPAPESHANMVTATRSDTSRFWGDAIGSSRWSESMASLSNDICLPLPLPPLTADIFKTGALNAPSQPEVDAMQGLEITPSNGTVHETKDAESRKRTRGDSSASEGLDQNQGGVKITGASVKAVEAATAQAQSRAMLKQMRKDRKEAAKRKSQGSEGTNGTNTAEAPPEPEAPFDYAVAESVLNGSEQAADGQGQSRRGNKPFKPYDKSNQGPRGPARGANREKAGKSLTFRN